MNGTPAQQVILLIHLHPAAVTVVWLLSVFSHSLSVFSRSPGPNHRNNFTGSAKLRQKTRLRVAFRQFAAFSDPRSPTRPNDRFTMLLLPFRRMVHRQPVTIPPLPIPHVFSWFVMGWFPTLQASGSVQPCFTA